MTVWVVLWWSDYDHCSVMGIWSTREKAKDAVMRCEPGRWHEQEWEIYGFVLDGEGVAVTSITMWREDGQWKERR